MKTIIRLFAAVLAAVPVLVSCYSEPLPEAIPEVIPEGGDNGSEQDTTARVIIVSFDTKATRTEFSKEGDYLSQPIFEEGNEIYVANGIGFEKPVIEYKNIGGKNVATISTTLSGSLKLVYPSNCVKLGHSEVKDEGTEDEEIWVQKPNEIAGIIVPPVQTGYFKDANICMAEMDAGDTKATFHNQTAVFVLDVPEGTTQLVVTALRKINETTGQRYTAEDEDSDELEFSVRATISREWDGGGSETDESTGETYTWDPWYYSSSEITVGEGTSEIPNPCFVSVMVEDDAVLLRDLNFDAQINVACGYMGGFSPVFLEKTFGEDFADEVIVQKGAIYTEVENHLHEYHVPPVYASKDYARAWADEDLETEGGDFFMWGELDGHSYDNGWTNFTEYSNGFASGNSTNYSTSFSISSYNSGDILRLEDDAVYQNWGGAWRMPTYDEFNDLHSSSNEVTAHFSNYGYVSGTNPPTTVNGTGTRYYWTSNKGSEGGSRAYPFKIQNNYLYTVTARKGDPPVEEVSSYYGIRIKAVTEYDPLE